MRKLICLLLLLSIPLVCFAQDATTKASPSYPLQLTIQSNKEIYELGDKIKLSLKFKNIGKKDISFCKYFLEHKLSEAIELKDKDGLVYKLIDMTKYELRIISKDDFVTLKYNEAYTLELQFDTVFASDSTWYYKRGCYIDYKLDECRERSLPVEIYEVTIHYKNVADYYQEPIVEGGYRRTKNIPVRNAWTGSLTSDAIQIEIVHKKGEITSEEYEVYSALFSQWIELYNRKNLFVINEIIYPGEFTQDEVGYFEEKSGIKLDKEVIEDFQAKDKRQAKLENKFNALLNVILLSDEEKRHILYKDVEKRMEGWDRFYGKFPDSKGIIGLSRVAFNKDRTIALLDYDILCGLLCGGGYRVLLEKKHGKWVIVESVMIMMS